METGQAIAVFRTKANITQEQLAAALFVSRDLVSKWETGRSRPDYKTLLKIAELLSVGMEELFDKDRILTEELSSCVTPERQTDPERLKTEINAFLESLSVRDRSVFIRRYYFFEDVSEIGTAYGISDGYVRTLLMRTRRKLKKYLKGVSS